jgi:type IV secretion system protein VirB2
VKLFKPSTKTISNAVIAIGTGLLASPAFAQFAPIVTTSTTVMTTVTAICLALTTAGIGIAGYRIMFQGATFRDCSNLLIGACVCGGAGTLAATFAS